jgi:hypothetical protein
VNNQGLRIKDPMAWLIDHIDRFYRPYVRRKRKRRVSSAKRIIELLFENRKGMYPEDIAKELGIKEQSLSKIMAKTRKMLPRGWRIVSVLYTKGFLRWTRYKLIIPKSRQKEMFDVQDRSRS